MEFMQLRSTVTLGIVKTGLGQTVIWDNLRGAGSLVSGNLGYIYYIHIGFIFNYTVSTMEIYNFTTVT